MSDGEPQDNPVPRQRIRAFFLGIMDDDAVPFEERIRAAHELAALEGYTGAQAGRTKQAKDEVVLIKETPKSKKVKEEAEVGDSQKA